MEINIQDHFPILKTFTKPTDRICLTKKELNSAIKEITTAVLQEAADSAKVIEGQDVNFGEVQDFNGGYSILKTRTSSKVDKLSITSTINKVKF